MKRILFLTKAVTSIDLARKLSIGYADGMESELKQVSRSVYAVIGPEGSTNFTIVKARDGSAALIDADIRRIDEVEGYGVKHLQSVYCSDCF